MLYNLKEALPIEEMAFPSEYKEPQDKLFWMTLNKEKSILTPDPHGFCCQLSFEIIKEDNPTAYNTIEECIAECDSIEIVDGENTTRSLGEQSSIITQNTRRTIPKLFKIDDTNYVLGVVDNTGNMVDSTIIRVSTMDGEVFYTHPQIKDRVLKVKIIKGE